MKCTVQFIQYENIQAGCEYTFIAASSSFTQKILDKLGNNKITGEKRYEDMRYDKKGRPYFIDTGVHDAIKVNVVDHREYLGQTKYDIG